MSTLAYGALTRKREEAEERKSTEAEPPGVKTYVDALAALVPAEVLAVHATVLEVTTTSEEDEAGETVTTITEPGTLEWVFWALLATTVVLYLLGLRRRKPEGWDLVRLLIPPLAFVGWTMLLQPSAFDAVDPGLGDADRTAIALIGALVFGAIAAALGQKADQSPLAS